MTNSVTLAPWCKSDPLEWVVWYNGALLAPTFSTKGAAAIYLDHVTRGLRKPEYPI